MIITKGERLDAIRIKPLTQVVILLGTTGESKAAACRFLLSGPGPAPTVSVLSITVTFPLFCFSSSATYNVFPDVPYWRNAAEHVNTNKNAIKLIRWNATNILNSLHVQIHPTERTQDFSVLQSKNRRVDFTDVRLTFIWCEETSWLKLAADSFRCECQHWQLYKLPFSQINKIVYGVTLHITQTTLCTLVSSRERTLTIIL